MIEMRSLGDILGDIHVHDIRWTRVELQGAVGFQVPPGAHFAVHFILNGNPNLKVQSRKNLGLRTGDAMIVLDRQAHIVSNSDDAEIHPFNPTSRWVIEEATEANRAEPIKPGNSVSSTVLAGFGRIHWPLELSQWELLPPILHGNQNFRPESVGREGMNGQLVSRPGGAHCVARYAEFLLVRELQRVLERSPGSLRASSSNHNKMEQALAALRQDPATPWSVTALAQLVGMSRSTFAECFSRYVGATPMAVVLRYRMELAARYLERKSLPIKEVASLVGYGSVASFTRAFSLHFGTPPAVYRKLVTERERLDLDAFPPEQPCLPG